MRSASLALALVLWGPGDVCCASASRARWAATGSSLLLYDADGSLAEELGLGRFRQESGPGSALKRTLLGGVSANGRFAWHFKKEELLRVARVDTVLASSATLAYLGTSGATLWESRRADAPAGLEPLLQSADGETALLIERSTSGWSATCVSFTGSRLAELGGYARLAKAYLTANGRYAMILGSGFEQPLTYVFLDLRKGARKELPASEVLLGVARIEEDGSVRSKTKTVFKFP